MRVIRRVCLIKKLLLIVPGLVFLLTGCTNYSSDLHPTDIQVYKFQKPGGYHIIEITKNKNTVKSVWSIVQHMKADKTALIRGVDHPRFCFDFSTSKKLNFNCFEVSGSQDHLILTETQGDQTRNHFILSTTASETIRNLYK